MVSTNDRSKLLQRFDHLGLDLASSAALTWDDFGAMAHNLAFCQAPLTKAVDRVTRQHRLGPRGAWSMELIAAGITYSHDLAKVFRIGRSLMTLEVAKLVKAGLVDSQMETQDRRLIKLSLTPGGLTAQKAMRAELERILRAGFSSYSTDEFRLCVKMLAGLRRSVAE